MKLTPPFFALSCVPWPKALLLSFASSLLTMLQVLGAAPHFETEIVPILTQAGCNAAACHGAATGKGGFKLSLFAEDILSDYHAMTRDRAGRRLDLIKPEQSLLLRKASRRLDHEGGRRLPHQSTAYAVVRAWITQGAPLGDASLHCVGLKTVPAEVIGAKSGAATPLEVIATFSDGSSREVSQWCRFESLDEQVASVSTNGEVIFHDPGITTIMLRFGDQSLGIRAGLPFSIASIDPAPNTMDSLPGPLDSLLEREWAKWQVKAEPAAPPHLLIRRLHLDLVGRLPTEQEARKWLDLISQPSQYELLVDELIASDRFAEYWSLKQADWLRLDSRKIGQDQGAEFHAWLREKVAQGESMLEMVQEMVRPAQALEGHPAVHFNRYARDPRDMAEYVGEVLLGSSIGCARCHNHPADRWTMKDYHDFAALFARTSYQAGRLVFQDLGDVPHPRTGEASQPRVLGMRDPLLPIQREDPLGALANWLGREGVDRFEKAFLNRLWKALFGRGIVDPVEDLRETNLPLIPGLLETMASAWRGQDHRLQSALKMMVMTRAYQQGSVPSIAEGGSQSLFNAMVSRPITERVWVDAIRQVTGVSDFLSETLPDGSAIAAWDHRIESFALDVLGRCRREASCQASSAIGGLARSLYWFNDSGFQRTLDQAGFQLSLESGDCDKRLQAVYWKALSRPVTQQEWAYWSALQSENNEGRSDFLSDALWAILNSQEFRWIH